MAIPARFGAIFVVAFLSVWTARGQDAAPAVFTARLVADQEFAGSVRKSTEAPAVVESQDGRRVPLSRVVTLESKRQRHGADAFSVRARFNRDDALSARSLISSNGNLVLASSVGNVEVSADALGEVERGTGSKAFLWQSFSEPMPAKESGPAIATDRWQSPPASLLLDRADQKSTHDLEPPVESGVLSLWFYDEGGVRAGERWSINMHFGGPEANPIIIEAGWDKPTTSVKGIDALRTKPLEVLRRTGWRRLTVEFGPERFLAAIDDETLAASFQRGLGRPLARVVIAAEPKTQGGAKVWIDDLSVSAPIMARKRMLADPSQVDLLLTGGDQWFGSGVLFSEAGIDLESSSEKPKRFPLKDVYSLRLPQKSVLPIQWTGEIGALELFDGSRIVASLNEADGKTWRVSHPILGTISLSAGAVKRWTPLVVGGRALIERGTIHLGTKFAPGFDRPFADGAYLAREFDLAKAPVSAFVSLWVRGIEGTGPQAPFASLLANEFLRSDVFLNGKRIDYLNRHVADRPTDWTQLRISVPAGILAAGKNKLDIRQDRPDPATNSYDEMEASSLAVEWSDAEAPPEKDKAAE